MLTAGYSNGFRADVPPYDIKVYAVPFHLSPHFRSDGIQIQQNGNAVIVPQWEAGGGFLARCCTHRKIPCCQIAAAIFPKTALVTPHAAVVDLDHIPRWCRFFLKERKVHIVIIQLCTQNSGQIIILPVPVSLENFTV